MQVERHDGFDRVIYEFAGAGAPGWRAEYVAQATERGKEFATLVSGRSILQVFFTDTATPAEAELHEYDGPNPLRFPDTDLVTEVHLTPSYGRITQSFIGVRTEPRPFTVTTLTAPTRIVVDIHD